MLIKSIPLDVDSVEFKYKIFICIKTWNVWLDLMVGWLAVTAYIETKDELRFCYAFSFHRIWILTLGGH